tara:strand:+ start:4562 stop:5080 length:519 start_codon:yes stop_codon:yes gene_type:complete
MGMDVYGKNPTDEVGEYFRRNVWGWHPLWDMCLDLFPELAGKVEYGHTNDGDGLNAVDSEALSNSLNEAVADGRVAAWISERNEIVANLPMEECYLCESTGIRTDEIGMQAGQHDKALSPEQATVLGREFGWCNGCDGKGEKAPFASWYGVEVGDATDWAGFLRSCGGFEIC